MRILHIIGTLDPAAGGAAEAVRILLNHAPEEDRNEVLTLDDPAALYLQAFPFPVHALGPQTSTFGYTARLLPWLRANRDAFDGVVVHGLWQYIGFASWWALRGHVPYMVFPHGMLDPYFKSAFPAKSPKKWAYWLLAESRVLRDAYRVLFTCAEEERLARQSFWPTTWVAEVVPFGTVPPGGDRDTQTRAFLDMCPQLRGRGFLLFLGRIHPKKGCDLLVEAFSHQAALDPSLDLVIAGPDPQGLRAQLEKPAIAAGVAHRIHWPGMLRGDPKWGAFHASEAFILPSHQENFGIAVAEALACGKPVLLSNKINIASEVEAFGAACVETDTLAGTERLLQRWMQMPPGSREAMASLALECFHARYDMRENAKIVARLFETKPAGSR